MLRLLILWNCVIAYVRNFVILEVTENEKKYIVYIKALRDNFVYKYV